MVVKSTDHVRKQFADVDQYFGDDPRNFADLTIPEHRTGPNAVHKVEKYMDDSIKKQDQKLIKSLVCSVRLHKSRAFRAIGW